MPAYTLSPDPIAVIPAAGLGLRLGTQESKEVVEVGGEPVAAHMLRRLALAGVDQAVVVLRSGKWDVPRALSRYRTLGVDLAYVVVDESPNELYSVAAGLPFTAGRVVALGYPDILFEPKNAYSALIERREATGADLVLGLFPTDRPERVDMVVLDDEQHPIEVVIKQPDRGLRYSWCMALWTPRFSAMLTEHVTAGAQTNAEPSVGDMVQAAIDSGLTTRAVVFDEGSYLDIGTPEDLAEARRIAAR